MKNKFYILLAVLLGWGCEKAVIDRPDPFAKPEKLIISLNFSYRETSSISGFVQFNNISNGFQSYTWNFGYKDKDGKEVISNEVGPYTFFPANGEYLVILKGVDVNGKEHITHQYVVVKNKGG
jgi:hypothetical protein